MQLQLHQMAKTVFRIRKNNVKLNIEKFKIRFSIDVQIKIDCNNLDSSFFLLSSALPQFNTMHTDISNIGMQN